MHFIQKISLWISQIYHLNPVNLFIIIFFSVNNGPILWRLITPERQFCMYNERVNYALTWLMSSSGTTEAGTIGLVPTMTPDLLPLPTWTDLCIWRLKACWAPDPPLELLVVLLVLPPTVLPHRLKYKQASF